MKKPVTSKNPLKPMILAAMKSAHGCNKVTNLTQVGPNTYEGNCLVRQNRTDLCRYDDLGRKQVTLEA